MVERRTGARVELWWWDKYGIYLVIGEEGKAESSVEAGGEAGMEMEVADSRLWWIKGKYNTGK